MKLSIVILNYNTPDLTKEAIASVLKNTKGKFFEIIVVDNGSVLLGKMPVGKGYKLIRSRENLGFAGGNNLARSYVKGEYILFLNSDTVVHEKTIAETLNYMETHQDVGAVTCKILLPSGGLDKDARRSFPTPWVALTHFSGLDRIFSMSKLFSKYWYGYKSADEEGEVEVLEGAYFLTRKSILDKVGWFSEDYFLDGEDIDLCWKVKSLGWKLIYYPKVSITHIKKASKKGRKTFKFVMAGVNSMEIFYKKFLWEKYILFLNLLVVIGIYVMKTLRSVRTLIP